MYFMHMSVVLTCGIPPFVKSSSSKKFKHFKEEKYGLKKILCNFDSYVRFLACTETLSRSLGYAWVYFCGGEHMLFPSYIIGVWGQVHSGKSHVDSSLSCTGREENF